MYRRQSVTSFSRLGRLLSGPRLLKVAKLMRRVANGDFLADEVNITEVDKSLITLPGVTHSIQLQPVYHSFFSVGDDLIERIEFKLKQCIISIEMQIYYIGHVFLQCT